MRIFKRHRDSRAPLSPRRMFLTVMLVLMASPLLSTDLRAQTPPAPTLQWDMSDAATGGYYRLSWGMPEGALAADAAPVYEVQAASMDAFSEPTVIYKGGDTARVISGQPDSVTYYRVRVHVGDRTSAWSEVLAATVEHHPLSRAFMFFIVGALVFVTTLVFIITASRRANQQTRTHG